MSATKEVNDSDQVQEHEVNIVCPRRGKVRASPEACRETGLIGDMARLHPSHLYEGKVPSPNLISMMVSCIVSLLKENTVASIMTILKTLSSFQREGTKLLTTTSLNLDENQNELLSL